MAGEVMITRKECASCAHNTEEGCNRVICEGQVCLDTVIQYKFLEARRHGTAGK